jgi:S-(hydroxymethyl)glutathione dehydrogenase/alcohol dehydrogenase
VRTTPAAVLVKQRAPLALMDVEIPPLGVGHVLVRVEASGICGKQLDEVGGKRGADPFIPHLLGHEGAGVVEAIGPGVRKVAPGDHVVLHWMKGSGIDAVPASFSCDGSAINAGCVTTFSRYTVASENRLTPIPADIPFDVASLLGCAATTGLGIVFNDANLKPGQSIAVFGAGGVGLNVLQGAALVHAWPIIAVDVTDRKLKLARVFGATHAVDGRAQDPLAVIRELTGGRGVDAAVDTTGITQVRQQAYNATSAVGRTILAGVPEEGERMTIDSFPLHFGRRMTGVHGGETKPDADIPRYLRLFRQGRLRLTEQITRRYPLARVNDAIAEVARGAAGRVVLLMR